MKRIYLASAAMAATLAVGSLALAQDGPRPSGGSSQDPSAKAPKPVKKANLPPVPIQVVTNAQYAVAGTGHRNRNSGVINISGFVPPAQKAILYWGALCLTASACASKIVLQRINPGTTAALTLTGTLIRTGADTCWGSNHAEY